VNKKDSNKINEKMENIKNSKNRTCNTHPNLLDANHIHLNLLDGNKSLKGGFKK
jgi:hypothetical protein